MINSLENLMANLTEIVGALKLRSHLSILNNWQRQNAKGIWEDVVTVNSKQNKPMLSFLQREENIHLRQVWQVPENHAAIPIMGVTIRLSLIWWADICEIWINGHKVQEGDLFDQKCRILLTDGAKPNHEFILEIKMNSPQHDIGALQLSELIFEYPHKPCDPEQFATELEILQTYIPIFTKQKIDLQPLEIAANRLKDLLFVSETIDDDNANDIFNHHFDDKFFEQLADIRKPLLQYGEFLKQRQIYILGNSHIDVAWLWAIAETKKAMQRTFTSALNLQAHYPEMIFNQSTALSYQWMEQEYPSLFARIQTAVTAGKWELIGGMWVEPDGNLPSGESLIRQILYGQEYFHKKFNRTVKIAWLPDTFGFHWQMPQILLKSGFEAFVTQKLLWNDTNKFPHQIFWWEGVDGSRIFTYFSNEIGQGLESVAIAKYLANQEVKHNIHETVWLYGVGDHGGGPTADMLDMSRKWSDAPIFFEMQSGTLEGFLLGLKEKNVDLPIWQDELYLEFHRGTFTTKAEQKRQNRQVEVLLGNVEKYRVIACLSENIPYPQAELESAWQGLLLNQFHDILPGTSIPEVFVDADRTWAEVREICDRLLDSQISESANLKAWNFLNWERSELIRKQDNSLCWLAIPSFGFVEVDTTGLIETENPLSLNSDSEKIYLANKYLQVEISRKTGAITQIYDQRSQQSILRSASDLQFFEDKGQYWDAWNIDPAYESKSMETDTLESIEVIENGSLCISLRIVRKFRSSKFLQEIQLTAFESFITVKNRVDWQEEQTLVKVAFPVLWRSPHVTYEIPMGTIERSTLGETAEAKAKWEVPAQYWADIASEQVGLAVLNDCKYGYDAKPDCLRLTLLRSPNWPSPNSDRGLHEFTYRLVPHQGSWRDAKIVRLAQELNNPIVLHHKAFHNAVSSNAPIQQSFLQVAAPNIVLSAFKRSQDRSGWIMRFYETHGQVTETDMEILSNLLPIEHIWECDLMETKGQRLSPDEGKANFWKVAFQPYEIKTLYITVSNCEIQKMATPFFELI
ncbi:alpha-mannosidase [Pseudanabaena sp. UWO310]|uniref:alpha-mannosidase n=1 Tax=Pseudanabaena sp. UWO310 TaxID=2480795 RepID=UPI00115AF334|nr:glycoside hydrolase family 38 C-terminal domain-containing protein [Pseudanabaena sp. UWO310]TYQ28162.1 alpha-mannosidase [Pseudanabaena sp. UWO310]